jgi:hypothetical protein
LLLRKFFLLFFSLYTRVATRTLNLTTRLRRPIQKEQIANHVDKPDTRTPAHPSRFTSVQLYILSWLPLLLHSPSNLWVREVLDGGMMRLNLWCWFSCSQMSCEKIVWWVEAMIWWVQATVDYEKG